jgi:hypothetical protein
MSEGREIALRPGARILDLSQRDLKKSASTDVDSVLIQMNEQSERVERLIVLLEKLVAGEDVQGYDAVQLADRLVILNPEALESEAPRKRWLGN